MRNDRSVVEVAVAAEADEAAGARDVLMMSVICVCQRVPTQLALQVSSTRGNDRNGVAMCVLCCGRERSWFVAARRKEGC